MLWTIRDLKQQECQKWQPEVDIFSLSVLPQQIHTAGVKTKAFRVVWDKSVPSSERDLPVAIHDVQDVSVLVA